MALDITEQLVRSGAIDTIIVDSVAALVPQAEIDGDIGDTHVGLQVRLMSQALRKLTSNIHHSRTAVVFINQLREKIGISYGSPEVTPGGRALKFYSSVRIDLRRIESIKQGAEITGNRVTSVDMFSSTMGTSSTTSTSTGAAFTLNQAINPAAERKATTINGIALAPASPLRDPNETMSSRAPSFDLFLIFEIPPV